MGVPGNGTCWLYSVMAALGVLESAMACPAWEDFQMSATQRDKDISQVWLNKMQGHLIADEGGEITIKMTEEEKDMFLKQQVFGSARRGNCQEPPPPHTHNNNNTTWHIKTSGTYQMHMTHRHYDGGTIWWPHSLLRDRGHLQHPNPGDRRIGAPEEKQRVSDDDYDSPS